MISVIIAFFVLHWYLSVLSQTFYLHRYASHGMFTMSKFWERVFHFCAFVFQGSSYLTPRAYAVLHRMHHAYSDTEKDPHSPRFFKEVFTMMWHTKKVYQDVLYKRMASAKRFEVNCPEWPVLDYIADSIAVRILWGFAYFCVYYFFAPTPWLFLLLPIHFLMGPVHGAIVNWCGHKYGYRNFELQDDSRNTFAVDMVCLGECFQNNHHMHPAQANFGMKPFEFDATYRVMKVLSKFGIIKMKRIADTRVDCYA